MRICLALTCRRIGRDYVHIGVSYDGLNEGRSGLFACLLIDQIDSGGKTECLSIVTVGDNRRISQSLPHSQVGNIAPILIGHCAQRFPVFEMPIHDVMIPPSLVATPKRRSARVNCRSTVDWKTIVSVERSNNLLRTVEYSTGGPWCRIRFHVRLGLRFRDPDIIACSIRRCWRDEHAHSDKCCCNSQFDGLHSSPLRRRCDARILWHCQRIVKNAR